MPKNSDRWGLWCESRPGCEPFAAQWMSCVDGHPVVFSRTLAESMAETLNRVNGDLWWYEARELATRAANRDLEK